MPVDLEKLTRPFPQTAIKQRQGGGGRMLDYIEGHTVIHRLNEATGNNWSSRVTRFERNGDLLLAVVELTIPGCGSREGMGVQKISDRGGEDLAKGVLTDALKKAATLYGIGLELYGPEYESGEIDAPIQRTSRPEPPRGQDVRSNEPAAPAGADGVNYATPKQIKYAMVVAGKAALSDEDVRTTIREMTGKESIKSMTVREASDLIAWIESQIPQEQPALAGVN